MSITLAVIDGQPCVEIADHRGKVASYAYAVLRDAGGIWQCRLTKLDGTGGPYVVVWGVYGWRCSCPDWCCRPAVRKDGCKHCRAARGLRALLEALRPAAVVAEGGRR